jgi:hypothetical protein
MQAITANVMADQANTTYIPGTNSAATRQMSDEGDGPETRGFTVTGRTQNEDADRFGTNLHEFTHASVGHTYDNTDLFLTYDAGMSAEGVKAESEGNAATLLDIWQSANASVEKNPLARFIREKATYAMGGGAASGYGDSVKSSIAALDTGISAMGNQSGQGKKARMEKDLASFRTLTLISPEAAGPGPAAVAPVIEYDTVVNQMLAQYEMGSPDRTSQLYRKIKAAALGAHVKRHNQRLKNRGGAAVLPDV